MGIARAQLTVRHFVLQSAQYLTATESAEYSSDETTARWIAETPVVVGTGGSGLAALPNLGKVHFTNADVNGKARLL
jgi:hypothetical protein